MSSETPPAAPKFVQVGYIDSEGLHTLHISFDAVAIARERGWMVWDDIAASAQAPTAAQGDGAWD